MAVRWVGESWRVRHRETSHSSGAASVVEYHNDGPEFAAKTDLRMSASASSNNTAVSARFMLNEYV